MLCSWMRYENYPNEDAWGKFNFFHFIVVNFDFTFTFVLKPSHNWTSQTVDVCKCQKSRTAESVVLKNDLKKKRDKMKNFIPL